jgi:hypothetical protein
MNTTAISKSNANKIAPLDAMSRLSGNVVRKIGTVATRSAAVPDGMYCSAGQPAISAE